MERGSVVKGSRGYKKSDEPAKGRVGVTCGPPIPVAGALEEGGMSAGIGLGMGNERRGGFRMDPGKRRRLQCERSVVHSGKSLSHAVSVELQHHAKSQ